MGREVVEEEVGLVNRGGEVIVTGFIVDVDPARVWLKLEFVVPGIAGSAAARAR